MIQYDYTLFLYKNVSFWGLNLSVLTFFYDLRLKTFLRRSYVTYYCNKKTTLLMLRYFIEFIVLLDHSMFFKF